MVVGAEQMLGWLMTSIPVQLVSESQLEIEEQSQILQLVYVSYTVTNYYNIPNNGYDGLFYVMFVSLDITRVFAGCGRKCNVARMARKF